MSRRQHKLAYKRLDITEYKGIIKGTGFVYFDEYDGEPVAILTPETVFTIKKHYNDNIFLGWNIYSDDNVLLETKSTKEKAERFLMKLGERN